MENPADPVLIQNTGNADKYLILPVIAVQTCRDRENAVFPI